MDMETMPLAVARPFFIAAPKSSSVDKALAKLYGTPLDPTTSELFGSDYDAHHYVMKGPTCQAHSISDFSAIAPTTSSPEFSKAFRESPLPFDYRAYNRRFK